MNRSARKWQFLIGAAGLVAGAVLFMTWMDASAACPLMPASYAPGNRCATVKFFYDWQQLLGGLFAIAAAGLGWLAINRQILQADAHEAERNRRKHAAARAMLPLALSSITEYAQECSDGLLPIYESRKDEVIPETVWHAPKVPAEAAVDLRAMIEASDPTESRPVAKLLARIQVQAARLRSLESGLRPGGSDATVVVALNVEQYAVDTIEIAAIAAAHFKFARGETDILPSAYPSREDAFNAASQLGIYPGLYPRIDERLDRQFKLKVGGS